MEEDGIQITCKHLSSAQRCILPVAEWLFLCFIFLCTKPLLRQCSNCLPCCPALENTQWGAWPGLVGILKMAKGLEWFCGLAKAAGWGQPSVVWPCWHTVVPDLWREAAALPSAEPHSHCAAEQMCELSYIFCAASVGEGIKRLQSLLLFLKRVRSQFDTCHCFFYVCSGFSALDILPF